MKAEEEAHIAEEERMDAEEEESARLMAGEYMYIAEEMRPKDEE